MIPVHSSDLMHCMRDSPFRPPDWRWRRAVLLYEHKRPFCRRTDDRYVRQAYEFLIAYKNCVDDWDRLQLRHKQRAMYDAWLMYEGRQDTLLLRKRATEARLLAVDATLPQVSELGNVEMSTLQLYETIFFHVRDRLGQLGYLLHQVVGPLIYTGLKDSDYDVFWKLYSVTGGIHTLEDMVWVIDRNILGSKIYSDRRRRDIARAIISKKAVQYGLTLKAQDQEIKMRLLELDTKYVEIEKALESSEFSTGDKAQDGLHQALGDMQFMVRNSTQAGLVPRIAASGAEMRASQAILASTGETVTLSERMRLAAFPSVKRDPPPDAPTAAA